MARILILVGAVCSVSLAGCEGIACTLQENSTIMFQVRDSISGQGAALGATVIVRGATVYDSVYVATTARNDSVLAYVANEYNVPAGQYTVTVRKPGYAQWQQAAVVTGGPCHSGPGPLIDARIQPNPGPEPAPK